MRTQPKHCLVMSCVIVACLANSFASAQSTYYLNFSPDMPGPIYPYSTTEKEIILEGLRDMYSAFPHMSFTLDVPTEPHSVVDFNSTAIGTSTGIDFRNVAFIDDAAINALKAFDFLGETSFSASDVVKASINLAGHEIGHLEGLRHHDAYTPIGGGMPAAVVGDYTPFYPGPADAVDTLSDVLSLTTSIPGGFTASQLTADLVIGQRDAIKLAYNADPGFFLESSLPGGPAGSSIATASPLPLKTIGVPNVTDPGDPIHGMGLFADVIAVSGEIEDPGGVLTSDYYSFFAHEGDFVQIEVLSEVISSRLDELNVAVAIYDPDEEDPDDFFEFYYGDFTNGDERESTDALLLDFVVPESKDYVIEVFAQLPHDPVGEYELYVASFRAVPEPSSIVMLAMGALVFAFQARRRFSGK